MMFFHESSKRDCCVRCFGPTAFLDEVSSACTCGEGANVVTADGECTCAADYLSTAANNNCVLCNGIGARLNADDECECEDPNAIVDATTGTCACNEDDDWFLFVARSQCRKCTAGLASLDQITGACVCSTENAVLDSTGVNCVCDDGFLQSHSNECIACGSVDGIIGTLVNDFCTCEAVNAVLVDGMCQCDKGYMAHNGGCVRCVGPLAVVNENGECSCPEGLVLSPELTCIVVCDGNAGSGLLDQNSGMDFSLNCFSAVEHYTVFIIML